VAVASDSGDTIDACFGRTGSFRIYRLAEDAGGCRYEFAETRPGPKPCRDKSHDEELLSRTAELLKDCGMVLAGRIGPGAVRALSDRGIVGLAVPLEIEDALKRLAGRNRSGGSGAPPGNSA
jgi:predicted Fe-Mo cluster-binding NifX family protein